MVTVKQFGPITYAIGTLQEILAATNIVAGSRALPNDVAGCTLEMGADGLWTGASVGTLTQVQADALVASGALASVKVGTPGNVAGALVRYGGVGVGWVAVVTPPAKRTIVPSSILPYLQSLDHTTPTFTWTGATMTGGNWGGGGLPFTNATFHQFGATAGSVNVSDGWPVDITPGTLLKTGVIANIWSEYVSPGFILGGATQYAFHRPIYSMFTSGDKIGITIKASKSSTVINLCVNGKGYTTTGTTSVGGFHTLTITMGPGPNYIEFTNAYWVYGFWCDSQSVFCPWRRDISVSVIGDSITGGANAYSSDTGWIAALCRGLGAQMRNYAIGGSGWFTGVDSNGDSTAFRARIPTAASPKPTIHYWFGGWNDGLQPANAFYNELIYCATEFARISPNTKQVVIGSWNIGAGSASVARCNNEQRAAANLLGLKFVDLCTQYPQNVTPALSGNTVDGGGYVDANGIGWTGGYSDTGSGQLGRQESFITAVNAAAMIQSGNSPHQTAAAAIALGQFILAKTLEV